MRLTGKNVVLATLMLAMTGCGGELVPVTGRVTLDAAPLVDGTVAFYPVSQSQGGTGYATIVNGSYSANTGRQSGLRPGEYRVTVTAYQPIPPDQPRIEQAPPLLTPDRYRRPETSGLRCTIASSGTTLDIPLESK
jgi:hypothetical protein